ncbi:IclR family transcriptional regulator [Brevibacterium atlanticum]|uniref:IclR family transcriptional regulator n=1 Tax=Brevibacterium atlanticum TaxID=2697563 RepID=UPI001AA1341A|nr:helix-turn-helix domain-containing protein [Brevibacterium atlanticum]
MAIIDICESTPRTASELADSLSLSIPTVHRLARAMVTHGLLARDREGSFRLGSRFGSSGLGQIARGPLRELVANTGEACQLWVPRASNRLCLVSESAPQELHVELREGTLLPLADGGTAARVINGETSTDGWVLTVSERTPGLTSISAPIHSGDGLLGAVCIVAPVARVSSDLGELYGTRLLVTASAIERALHPVA